MPGALSKPHMIGLDEGPAFVFGFGFKDNAAEALSWETMEAAGYDWRWIHLNINHEEARSWIRSGASLPAAAASALLAGETRPRVTTFGEGLVVNLRGVNLNEGAEPEDMVSLRIWIDARRIISVRLRKLRAAIDVREAVEEGLRPSGPGALVSKLASRLIDRIQPYVQEIEDEVDGLEDAMLSGGSSGLRAQLADTRHDAVLLRRFIAPQRDALTRLAMDEAPLFDHATKIELREIADLVTRQTESIDAARERAMVLQDQLTDQRAEEMNRNMMILSVAAAVFLPLGFLTGLFGINVGGMPGVDSPLAFWLVCAACVLIGGALVLVFKAMKWL